MTDTFQKFVDELEDGDHQNFDHLKDELQREIDRERMLLEQGRHDEASLLKAFMGNETLGQFLNVGQRRFLFYPRLSALADAHGEILGWAVRYFLAQLYMGRLADQLLQLSSQNISRLKLIAKQHELDFGHDEDIQELLQVTVDRVKSAHRKALEGYQKDTGI